MDNLAIVGMSCRFPDARSTTELWENAVTGRRAFRRIPAGRLRPDDYWDPDPTVPDRTYARTAAVIDGYAFDRLAFRVAGSTFRATDLTHWLALDVAAQALADAGFPDGAGLPRERTAVVVGNTLTGEFTRANVLRLRWPYVRRVVGSALREQGWSTERLGTFLDGLEAAYKAPFPPVDEDTLAGSLSNTIAGRICNHFDLGGGGYTVDGACSSSLLSVVTACRSLAEGDVDVAVAGGVDLSIDPFEIVGFAKTGALARHEMRVYDRQSQGFWPGEGCGMVVLMRQRDAVAAGRRIYATVAGWGVSSDGRGGMTRPEVAGYRLALDRAYRRAGFGVDTVPVFEGHGTGTAVGDATELRALGAARRDADPAGPAAAISSIKALIGHTKAAAGVAGLIKAALAVHHRVVPPTAGCVEPHPEFTTGRPALRMVPAAEPWPDGAPPRAGVTAMGFGGINTHVVLEGGSTPAPRAQVERITRLGRAAQDAELLLLDADRPDELRDRVRELRPLVARLSYGELTDLAASLRERVTGRAYRLAVVGAGPEEVERRLGPVADALDAGRDELTSDGVFLRRVTGPGRIGFLFPGQGSGRSTRGGALRRRFATADEVYRTAGLRADADGVRTEVAQPRVVTGSLAALRVLDELGVTATVAVGHSLGELTALHWAGCTDAATLLRIAAARGAAMARCAEPGTMAGIAADATVVGGLIGAEPVVIAGHNGPRQTVVSGPLDAVRRVCAVAGVRGLEWAELAVSHAFHSPLMRPAEREFAAWLADVPFAAPHRAVASTVTGGPLPAGVDVHDLLRRQVTGPVRFADAVRAAAGTGVDLFVEVGPGRVLSRMAGDLAEVPAIAVDTDGSSLAGLVAAVGAAWAVGAPVRLDRLFAGRLVRPFDPAAEPTFFTNPCETAPELAVPAAPAAPAAEPATTPAGGGGEAVDVLRRLAARRAELPLESVTAGTRLLDGLHLSSIAIGQLVNEAARELGLAAVTAPTTFATATVGQLADTLRALAGTEPDRRQPTEVMGVAPWVRPFRVALVARPLPPRVAPRRSGAWRLHAAPDHPFAAALRDALERAELGPGVLLCLPGEATVAELPLALAAVQAAVTGPDGARLVVVQRGRGVAALARTARLERPGLLTTVVDLPADGDPVTRVVAEVAGTEGFTEARYDADGTRRVPLLRRPTGGAPPAGPPLHAEDVLLVSGGGRGITAECAAALAADTGVRVAVLGRADPDRDVELAANLDRLRAAGTAVHYVRADVTDRAAVRAAVSEVTRVLGPVTAVLHGAGRNEPAALAALDLPTLHRTLAPKVDGLRAVLDAVDPARLRLLVTFGSIIGRAGLPGEGHYALANDWLAELTAEVGRRHPGCRAICLEWSVWSGVGMGERLAVVESLARAGVTPITPDQGVRLLREVLAEPDPPAAVVVAGRTGNLDTLGYDHRELPLLRFLERPIVHYDGVELVTEVDLSAAADRYLEDHRLDGSLLFPAVFGLEAMAQVATALIGASGVPVVHDAEFTRPVVVPPGGSTTVRIAALASAEGRVEVALRSAETGFAADHFRATLSFGPVDASADDPEPLAGDPPPVSLDPARELYHDVLFQQGRFRRLLRYRRVVARHAEADVSTTDDVGWFHPALPTALVLGDPGARDAFMHGLQVCVPDATLLPVGVDRIEPAGPKLAASEEVRFTAAEREHTGDTYVYDVTVRTVSGTVVERWRGLRLRAVGRRNPAAPWTPALLGPYLTRRLPEVLGVDLPVVVEPHGTRLDLAGRRAVTATALSRALGRPVRLDHRPDGRPEIAGGPVVSASHQPGMSLVVADAYPVACDLEAVTERPAAAWRDLLGPHLPLAELIAAETGDRAAAYTRVWCAVECLQKAGQPPTAPLALGPPAPAPGWTVLTCGELRVATLVAAVRDRVEPVVLAVATGRRACG
ncbi:type I polyketide synthase [Micromonospora sp. WMMD1128]|uniref:type I polyketide synthase n=1 Tax=Micromonospora sp. WMMD1128 TaxID=3015150 RepID=UPI00248B22E5|nr:type I polyketide synthase [Micromonospora sp. WMMD1128]WBB75814.1 type I polyketide synthase [Micromonospora sp. WMMD1128]